MSKVKAGLPSGTRDFLPKEVARRNYLFSVIKFVFEKYGFQQIETPAMEKIETLTGKYGDEGDQLLFKILNSGNPFNDLNIYDIEYLKSDNGEIINKLSEDFENSIKAKVPFEKAMESQKTTMNSIVGKMVERGLRYDLTVPLARYAVQHYGDLPVPFKRYHIAPVWRADRPQKGRYREFYQCDADVIGSDSLLNEVELTNIFAEVFSALKLNVTIRINSRKILEAIAVFADVRERLTELTTAIDKFDKVGLDGVLKELETRDFSAEKVEKIKTLLQVKSVDELKKIIGENEGIAELEKVFSLANIPNLEFDITLARGLNYYTGVIWEIKSNDTQIGSIGSGGRYANLTEMFGGQNMSGVGISFGVERIYDVMTELNLFPETVLQGVQVLFVAREESLENFAFTQAQKLRVQGISAEFFLGNAKKQKHFKYAEDKGISFMIEIGSDEKEIGIFRFKNLKTREEQRLRLDEIISLLKK